MDNVLMAYLLENRHLTLQALLELLVQPVG